MSTTIVQNPTSRVRFGFGRSDITPPVGIYHRLWGAARHDRASGVHRPLFAEVMYFAPLAGETAPMIRVQMDLAGLDEGQHEEMRQAIAKAAGVPRIA